MVSMVFHIVMLGPFIAAGMLSKLRRPRDAIELGLPQQIETGCVVCIPNAMNIYNIYIYRYNYIDIV